MPRGRGTQAGAYVAAAPCRQTGTADVSLAINPTREGLCKLRAEARGIIDKDVACHRAVNKGPVRQARPTVTPAVTSSRVDENIHQTNKRISS